MGANKILRHALAVAVRSSETVLGVGVTLTGLDAATYGHAYRKVDRRPDRERQIDLIEHLGQSLDRLARRPFVTATLAMMRKPAELAGLGDLQSFLERGYAAFKKMGGADEFLGLVISREKKVLKSLFRR